MKINEEFFNSNLITGTILFLFLNSFRPVFSGFASPDFIIFLKNNDYIRLILLYFIIYFFLYNILNDYNKNVNEEVTNILVISFFILLFLILFTRQPKVFNIIEMLCLLVIYLLDNNDTDYYIIYFFYGILVLLLLIGFYFYYLKQLREKGNRFSYVKFLIGNKEKDYIK